MGMNRRNKITVRHEISGEELKNAFTSEEKFEEFISKHAKAIATKAEDEYMIANAEEMLKIIRAATSTACKI